jgi:hypothetical protein
MTSQKLQAILSIGNEDVTYPSEAAKYPIGTKIRVEDGLNTEKEYMYVQSHGALTQYQPYIINHTGVTLKTGAPATGAALIGVPQVAFTSGYYGFVQIRGDATVKIGAETYVAGDHLEVLNTGTLSVVDGTSGSTVETVNSFGVSKAAGSSATTIAAYLLGNKADIAAS